MTEKILWEICRNAWKIFKTNHCKKIPEETLEEILKETLDTIIKKFEEEFLKQGSLKELLDKVLKKSVWNFWKKSILQFWKAIHWRFSKKVFGGELAEGISRRIPQGFQENFRKESGRNTKTNVGGISERIYRRLYKGIPCRISDGILGELFKGVLGRVS